MPKLENRIDKKIKIRYNNIKLNIKKCVDREKVVVQIFRESPGGVRRYLIYWQARPWAALPKAKAIKQSRFLPVILENIFAN